MTFISYAQNYEDVMLWRALKRVERGFYIDAGAWSPELDSVTKAFYEKGWRGINIEPNPKFHAQLDQKRPHDVNLCVAVSDAQGSAEMNLLSNSGLSTLDDAIARSHVAAGWNLEKIAVQVTTLEEIWKDHVPDKQDVHFLKIDVEGFERQALSGNDWKQCRPWIVVVEATLPEEKTELYESWEPILLNADYAFAYADGLNRFYVARERAELLPAFQYPPNYFDHFRPHALVVSEAKVKEADSRAQQAEVRTEWLQSRWDAMQARLEALAGQESAAKAETARLEARLAEKSEALSTTQLALAEKLRESRFLEKERSEMQFRLAELDRSLQHWRIVAENLNLQLQEVYKSRSWRITGPYRFVGRGVRWVLSFFRDVMQKIETGMELILRSFLQATMRAVYRRPRLKDLLKKRLERYPRLWQRLALQARDAGIFAVRSESPTRSEGESLFQRSPSRRNRTDHSLSGYDGDHPTDQFASARQEHADKTHLSASARRIYRDLKRAIETSRD